MGRKLIKMAITYDFDGTLAPGNMQEHQFLPAIGITKTAFWKEVSATSKAHDADEILVYMNLMLAKARGKQIPVRREDFKKRGKAIRLFKGVLKSRLPTSTTPTTGPWRAFCRRVERPELAKSLPQVAAEIMLNSRPYCFS